MALYKLFYLLTWIQNNEIERYITDDDAAIVEKSRTGGSNSSSTARSARWPIRPVTNMGLQNVYDKDRSPAVLFAYSKNKKGTNEIQLRFNGLEIPVRKDIKFLRVTLKVMATHWQDKSWIWTRKPWEKMQSAQRVRRSNKVTGCVQAANANGSSCTVLLERVFWQGSLGLDKIDLAK